ncbi:hypothetical protein Tco_1014569 [Tanacetum coccineum]
MDSTDSEDEVATNHPDDNVNEEQEDDDDVDDDLYDDDSGSEIFFKEIDDEFLSGGGWIKELNENSLNTTTINSEFCDDGFRQYSNNPIPSESQTSNTGESQKGYVGQSISPTFVLHNHIEDTSNTKNDFFEVKSTDIDKVDSLETYDTERYSSIPCTFDVITGNQRPFLNPGGNKTQENTTSPYNPIPSLLGPLPTINLPSLENCGPNSSSMIDGPNLTKQKKKKQPTAYVCNTTSDPSPTNVPTSKAVERKPTKYASLKLIDSINGINTLLIKKKKSNKQTIDNTHNDITTNTSSTSLSNNDSNIQRCNSRLLCNTIATNTDCENEVLKTIEIGSTIGYNMEGRELEVKSVMGDTIVNQ